MPTSFPLAPTASHSQLTELLTGFLPVQWQSTDLFSIHWSTSPPVMETFSIYSFLDNNQLHWPAPSQRISYFWSPSAGLLLSSFGTSTSLCHKAMNNSHPPGVLPDFTGLCHISFPCSPSWGVLVHSVPPHAEAVPHLWRASQFFSEPSVSASLWRGNGESSMSVTQVNRNFCSITAMFPVPSLGHPLIFSWLVFYTTAEQRADVLMEISIITPKILPRNWVTTSLISLWHGNQLSVHHFIRTVLGKSHQSP